MKRYATVQECVDELVGDIGRQIIVATPLGIGKPNQLLNGLYQRALADSGFELTVMTALTLERPRAKSELERRFMDPLTERVFGDYPDLDYAVARRSGALPGNVSVKEFYFAPGQWLGNSNAQQNYLSSNYTHVARDLVDAGCNVVAQMVAKRESGGAPDLSLSCNPDVTLDLVPRLRAREERRVAVIGQVNRQLPYMYGDAVVGPGFFDGLIDNPDYDFRLFGPPRGPVSDADYLIGLYASTLIRDGGTIQVGIGSLGDALVYSLGLRHQRNDTYRRLLAEIGLERRFGDVAGRFGGLDVLDEGLFGATEMLVDGFMHLFKAGILKRRVYDDCNIQKLLNEGTIGDTVTRLSLLALRDAGAVDNALDDAGIAWLRKYGIVREDVRVADGALIDANGHAVAARIDAIAKDPEAQVLGEQLRGGVVAQGGFFLGPADFYAWLNGLDEDERRLIDMTSVSRINQLYGSEEIDVLQRRDARFLNSSMIMTLLGGAASDTLESGQVVSGVGGQYNFVAMAHALPGGHSILKVRSQRTSKGRVESNIRFGYGNLTVPRHLRDIVVTEYGIADLRGRTDAEVVKAMLNVSDSRFQGELAADAKRAGKLEKNYQIPEAHRGNTPTSVRDALSGLKSDGLFPAFPYGTDLTPVEIKLGKALKWLKVATATNPARARLALKAAQAAQPASSQVFLERMRLDRPAGLKEKLYARLVLTALKETGAI